MDDPDRKRTTPGTQLWTLQKGGRQVSLLVTDLDSGGFELKVTRSDAATRSVHLFRVREDALAEVGRRVTNYLAHGWAIDSEHR
jgi:hypothetical protein